MTRWPVGLLLQRQRLGELDHLAGGEVELGGARARVEVDLDLGELALRRGVEPPQRTRPTRVNRPSLPS